VNTFLPYPGFEQSAACLDWRRLGKQRVEARQIITVLQATGQGFPDSKPRDVKVGWRNHPAVRMWRRHEPALGAYLNACVREWIRRGYRNTMELYPVGPDFAYPPWMGRRTFHASHRSNLLGKNPSWYGRFGWTEQPGLPYVWPA